MDVDCGIGCMDKPLSLQFSCDCVPACHRLSKTQSRQPAASPRSASSALGTMQSGHLWTQCGAASTSQSHTVLAQPQRKHITSKAAALNASLELTSAPYLTHVILKQRTPTPVQGIIRCWFHIGLLPISACYPRFSSTRRLLKCS